jgi:hypothetical protein
MAIAKHLIEELISAPRGSARISAAARLVMWFSVGAFTTSTVAYYLEVYTLASPHGNLIEILGGAVVVGLGVFLKAA